MFPSGYGKVQNKLCLAKLALVLVLSFQDSLTILRKRKFSEMTVKSKKGINLENLPSTEGFTWQHSLKFTDKSHIGKYYTKQHLIRQNGAGNSQRIT